MLIFETLAPLILLIGLGAVLAHIRFLGTQFMADMNKLAFWIALPALFFLSATHTQAPGPQTWLLLGVMLVGTLLICPVAWLVGLPLRLPSSANGTIMQSAFRGNLAYIGVPVLAYSFSLNPAGDVAKSMATAVLVVVLIMIFYNLLAVLVLHQHDTNRPGLDWKRLFLTMATNPLVVSGILGLLVAFSGVRLPNFFTRALDVLGGAAVPLSLLCIGGSLTTTTLQGKRSWITAAALLKVLVLPVMIFLFGRLAGLNPAEMRIAVVIAACPTAAAAFVMVSSMGGDKALASGSIALSTLLSLISLSLALWITG